MRTLFLIFSLLGANVLLAQTFPVDTLVFNGNGDNRINLVLLGDGYRTQDMDKFQSDALTFIDAFFQETPYAQYKRYFNVFKIRTPSVEAGANHPGTATDVSEPTHPVVTVNNYFGSTFDYANIHRLLVSTNSFNIYNVLASNFPTYDQVVMLVNSPYYGGSGGQYAVVSTDNSATEVALHEVGHSFAYLADEYWFTGGESANRTAETNPLLVKWKNWYGTNEVGIYQYCCGAGSENWYRPHQNCKMRYLGPDFCPICTEAIVERIHSLTWPLDSFAPQTLKFQTMQDTLPFSVYLNHPEPNTLKVSWRLNDSLLDLHTESILLPANLLHPGVYNPLICTIEDTTKLVRVDEHGTIHYYEAFWKIEKAVSGTGMIVGASQAVEFMLYPNPATNYALLRVKGDFSAPATVRLVDVNARILQTLKLSDHNTDQIYKMDLKDYPKGIYTVEVCIGAEKKVLQLVKQ